MMNHKNIKFLMNGVLLAAVAAVGVMAYQIVKSPVEEQLFPGETQVEMVKEKEEESEKISPFVDAGTSNVTGKKNGKTKEIPKRQESKQMNEKEKMDAAEADSENMESEEAAETAASASGRIMTSSASLHFSENTSMEWPVQGRILLDYNMDQTIYFPTLDQYRLNPAIAVQAVTGAPVVAGVTGMVYSIDENPKTGTTVTMELGDGYQAIYGQLTGLTVCKGEHVTKGSVIGYINTPTKYYSAEGSNLYFAMKKDGKPIDPILYLP